MFDIEYIFLQIRSKSVGENVEVIVKCPDDNETKVPVKINLQDVSVQMTTGHSNEIKLSDNMKLVLRYPILRDMKNIKGDNEVDKVFEALLLCIHEIHHNDKIFNAIDVTKEELQTFVEQMTSGQLELIMEFFQTMPKHKEKRRGRCGGPPKFFSISLNHDTLDNYYRTNFAMMQHHNYSLKELEDMMPWEREIYLGLLLKHVEKEKEIREKENQRG
jgi:hypothetical protein